MPPYLVLYKYIKNIPFIKNRQEFQNINKHINKSYVHI
jgi:hypothetical protein